MKPCLFNQETQANLYSVNGNTRYGSIRLNYDGLIEAFDDGGVLLGTFDYEDDAVNAVFGNDDDPVAIAAKEPGDIPDEYTIDIPADEVSAQWGKFPPGMTAPPWQADWLYVAGSKEEAAHIASLGLPVVCREELGPKQIPILQDADVVLLNNDDDELVAALAAVARQLRVVNVPNLTSCSKEEFLRLTKSHWAEGTRSLEPPNGEPAYDDQERESPMRSTRHVGRKFYPVRYPARLHSLQARPARRDRAHDRR